VSTLDALEEGTLVAAPQIGSGVSYAPKVTVDDARVTWNEPAIGIDRLIRACTPAPGAWTTLEGDRVKIGPIRICTELEPLPIGRISVSKTAVLVGTATFPAQLGEVQATGKRVMLAADWARGMRLAENAEFV
jgi:methionyl-tRNA formyltransferase